MAEERRHPSSKWINAGASPAGSTFSFPLKHGVCCRPVKTCERVATPRGGAISQTEHVRPVEEPVLKTVAPCNMASGVQVPGAPPLSITPDSSKAEQPAHIRQTGERYLVGRPFHSYSSVAQKQSSRSITGRPRRATARRDHHAGWQSQSMQPPEERTIPVRFRVQRPLSRHWCNSKHSCLPSRQRRGSTGMAHQFLLLWCKRGTRLCEGRGQGAIPCRSTSSIASVADAVMHRPRNADHAGAAPAGGSSSMEIIV